MKNRMKGFFVCASVAGIALLVACGEAPEAEAPVVEAPKAEEAVASTSAALTTEPNFCWLDSYGRGVGAIPDTCPAGQQLDAGLCYPVCQPGYYNVGPVCWAHCPAGFTDDGATCRKDAHIFGKSSYGRGAGTVPSSCNPGDQRDGALCYPGCKSGYYGVGPVCWQSCGNGYADHGATCFQHIFSFYFKASYGRGAGYAPGQCAPGQENQAGLCYPRCGAPAYGVGPVCYTPCPAGYTDDGATCRKDAIIFGKNTYGRGVGAVPTACSGGRQYDAGLCYSQCESAYNGIGPVCWGKCPASLPVSCGAGCAATGQACSTTIANQVSSTLQMGANIAALVATAGGSAVATYTAKVAIGVAERAAMKAAIKQALREAGRDLTEDALEALAEQMTNAAVNGEDIDWSAVDPTGIAAVVGAFNAPVCKDVKPPAPPAGAALVYGQTYHLQNGYADWGGGYLDTNHAGCDGNVLCVSTATTPNRAAGSTTASWILLSATGKANGTPVQTGDLVRLANKYPHIPVGGQPVPGLSSFGGFLDVSGGGCEGNHLCVSTAASPNRDGQSGAWKISSDTPTVTVGKAFTLQNGYSNLSGGYLDIRGAGCEGNAYCVSTSGTPTRHGASTSWRASAASQ